MNDTLKKENEYIRTYWTYYKNLEDSFIKTEQYLAIDKYNFKSYSNEYLKLLVVICSEIDVLCKKICKIYDNYKSAEDIIDYRNILINKNDNLGLIKLNLRLYEIDIQPWIKWEEWKLNGGSKDYNAPTWWQAYNSIKHNRTDINKNINIQSYKLANQENVINALGALYILHVIYQIENKLHSYEYNSELFDVVCGTGICLV